MPEGMNCLKNIDNKMEAYKILDRKRMISWSPNWSQKIKDQDHLEKIIIIKDQVKDQFGFVI